MSLPEAVAATEDSLGLLAKSSTSRGMPALSDTEKQGHDGMGFIMMSRLITAFNQRLPLDLNIYDGVMWSVATTLSERSVANGSKPVSMPDFTSGLWAKPRKHEIQRTLN